MIEVYRHFPDGTPFYVREWGDPLTRAEVRRPYCQFWIVVDKQEHLIVEALQGPSNQEQNLNPALKEAFLRRVHQLTQRYPLLESSQRYDVLIHNGYLTPESKPDMVRLRNAMPTIRNWDVVIFKQVTPPPHQ